MPKSKAGKTYIGFEVDVGVAAKVRKYCRDKGLKIGHFCRESILMRLNSEGKKKKR